jgi:hypothetical protein
MPPPKENGPCKCEWFERAADDPMCPVEFDAELNEYHLVRGPNDFMMIYTKLSEFADVHITIYPTDRVGISFQGKAVKKNAG